MQTTEIKHNGTSLAYGKKLLPRIAISQVRIVARTLTLMQGVEGKRMQSKSPFLPPIRDCGCLRHFHRLATS